MAPAEAPLCTTSLRVPAAAAVQAPLRSEAAAMSLANSAAKLATSSARPAVQRSSGTVLLQALAQAKRDIGHTHVHVMVGVLLIFRSSNTIAKYVVAEVGIGANDAIRPHGATTLVDVTTY